MRKTQWNPVRRLTLEGTITALQANHVIAGFQQGN
jgi:hypothetical protein